jgi:hypothetical protein
MLEVVLGTGNKIMVIYSCSAFILPMNALSHNDRFYQLIEICGNWGQTTFLREPGPRLKRRARTLSTEISPVLMAWLMFRENPAKTMSCNRTK